MEREKQVTFVVAPLLLKMYNMCMCAAIIWLHTERDNRETDRQRQTKIKIESGEGKKREEQPIIGSFCSTALDLY